jgi:hypothetical protein
MLFAIIILAVLPFMNYYTSVPVIFIKKKWGEKQIFDLNFFVYTFQTGVVLVQKFFFWSFLLILVV